MRTLVELRIRRAARTGCATCSSRDGYWWAELTADTTLESDYILFQLWLHPPENGVWNPPTRPLIDKAAQSILERQIAGWRFQHLSAGAHGSQRDGEGVFRA